jgi:hypothetical protein
VPLIAATPPEVTILVTQGMDCEPTLSTAVPTAKLLSDLRFAVLGAVFLVVTGGAHTWFQSEKHAAMGTWEWFIPTGRPRLYIRTGALRRSPQHRSHSPSQVARLALIHPRRSGPP